MNRFFHDFLLLKSALGQSYRFVFENVRCLNFSSYHRFIRSQFKISSSSLLKKTKIIRCKTSLIVISSFLILCSCDKQIQLTQKEQAWLDTHKVYVPAGLHVPPFAFTDQSGKYTGMIVDIGELMAKRLKYQNNFVQTESMGSMMQQVLKGEITYTMMQASPEREKLFCFTKPVLFMPYVLITRQSHKKDLSMKNLAGKKVTVCKDYLIENYIRENYPDIIVATVPNEEKGLTQVAFGESEIFIGNLAYCSWAIEKKGITNLKISGDTNFINKIAWATNKENIVFRDIMQKFFDSIPEHELFELQKKWVHVKRDSIINNKNIYFFLLLISGILITILLVIFWNYILRRTVRIQLEVIQKTEGRLNLAMSIANDGMWDWNLLDNSLYFDPRCYTMAGYEPDEFPAEFEEFTKRVHPDDNEPVLSVIDAHMKGEADTIDIEFQFMKKNGDWMWIRSKGGIVSRDKNGKAIQIVGTQTDISKHKLQENELKKSEERYRNLYKNAPIGLYRADINNNIISANSTFLQMSGHDSEDDLLKSSITDYYINTENRSNFIEQLQTEGRVVDYELLLQNKNGEKFWGLLSAVISKGKNDNSFYYDGFISDITETKRLQSQLIQAQKMESIGTLAGGIAHDFNNILGAILGYAQLAQNITPDNPKVQNYIVQLCIAGERAKGLVRQILDFSRQTKSKKFPIDIGIAIKEALKLLRASIPSTIEIRHNIKSGLGTVKADQTKIHQIVINLCTNAAHAMEKDGGQLEVDLIPVKITDNDASDYFDLRAGNYLKLIVKDTGHGIDTKTITRIFEPYFTTKEVGKGTGMGLATVHGIVKEHNGDIKVFSNGTEGTTFEILFPIIEEKVFDTVETQISIPTGNEKILFIDDEKLLTDIGQEFLEDLGYIVEAQTKPCDALEAFRSQPDKYNLVITDMTMPKMTGEKLAEEIKKIRHEIPIILCTGFSKQNISESPSESNFIKILKKPLKLNNLAEIIREILDEENQ